MRAEVTEYIRQVVAAVEAACWDNYGREMKRLTLAYPEGVPVRRFEQHTLEGYIATIPLPEVLVKPESLANVSDQDLADEIYRRANGASSSGVDVIDALRNGGALRALSAVLEAEKIHHQTPRAAAEAAGVWITERRRKAKGYREAICREESGCKHCDLVHTVLQRIGL